jgi:hypothetical protein
LYMLRGQGLYVLNGGFCNTARVSNGLIGLLILDTKCIPLQSAHQFALFLSQSFTIAPKPQQPR